MTIHESNHFLISQCDFLINKLNKDMQWKEGEPPKIFIKNGCGIYRTSNINLRSNFDSFKIKFMSIPRELYNFAWSLKTMGIAIKFESIEWHNTQDSGFNILGDIGFFILKFKFKKYKTNEK